MEHLMKTETGCFSLNLHSNHRMGRVSRTISEILYYFFPKYGVITPSRIKSFICWHVPLLSAERVYRLFHPDNIFTIQNDVKMYLPCKRDYVQTEIILNSQFYEHDELTKIHEFINPGMVFLDIGANVGNHSVYFAYILKARKVYSFEPVKLTASICRENIRLNGLEDIITLFEYGLGKEDSKAKIIFDGLSVNNLGGTTLEECETGAIEIKKLDNLKIPEKIDFMKIDVEGMEASVLLGAKDTILRDRPVLWVEIFDKNYENVNRILHSMGYAQVMILSKDNYVFRGV